MLLSFTGASLLSLSIHTVTLPHPQLPADTMSHHYFLCDKEQTHDFQSPSHHKPDLIWSLSITSHHIKVKVMSFSSRAMMTPPSRLHLQSEAHAATSFTEAVSLTKFELLQHTDRTVCKKRKKKVLPCANKTADAHSRTQPFIISVYLLPVAVPDKNLAFTAICSGQGVSRAGCMAISLFELYSMNLGVQVSI